MELPGWLTLNGFVLLIDAMLLFSVLNKRIRTLQDRTYTQLLAIVLALIIMDSLSRVRTGLVPNFPLWLDQLGTYFIFVCDPLGYLFALRYIDSWIVPTEDKHVLRNVTMGICTAYVALNIIGVTASELLGLGWFYSYLPDGTYARGPLYIPRGIANMVFCLVVGLYAVLRRRDIRERYGRFILAFPLIVLFSGSLQVFIGGAAFEYAGTIFACLLLYLFVQDHNMNVDYLTGLLNRRGIDRELEILSSRRSKNHRVLIFMIDLDHFKRINDEHGHDAGDKALRAMAGFLSQAFDPSYRIGRFGGDEFFVLSENLAIGAVTDEQFLEQAKSRTEKLRTLCDRANATDENPFEIHFSAGYDVFSAEELERDSAAVIERVDKLMYAQKVEHHALERA